MVRLREDVVGLRHEADALGDQRVGALVGDVLALAASTVPVWILTRPNSALSRVDLPAPLGPMMPTSSPWLAVEVGAVEDVDPGQVAGDQVVGAQHGAVGGREVRVSRVLACVVVEPRSSASSLSSARLGCSFASSLVELGLGLGISARPSISVRSVSWWAPR